MNCKPGGLAIVVGGGPDDKRTIGSVIKLTRIDPNWHSPAWEYEEPFVLDDYGFKVLAFAYSFLRPIRDNDGEDETLTWAGKPESINA